MKNFKHLANNISKEDLLEVLSRLLPQRSQFYAKVIVADLENLPHLWVNLTNSQPQSEESSIQNSTIKSETTHSSSYVSSFSVEIIKAELTTGVRDTVEKIAIACIKSHQKLAENIAQLWDGFNIPDRLLILIPETWEDLTETIEILTNVAQKTAGKICELGFIQFGNGYFSRCENNDQPTSVFSVASFAASLHLERPKLKIRVVEFDHRLSLEIINQKIKAEFTTSDNYSVAGYNYEMQRSQMVYDLAQKKSQSRNVNLTSEDVIIVTGGAKGITAECAIAVAEKYHCKMALVGSSLHRCSINS